MPRAVIALTLACMALAGCEPDASPPPSAPPTAPEAPAPSPAADATPGPLGALPPAGRAARYVGRWAAAETACGHEAWDFSPDGLQTAGEVACRFQRVTPAPGGYDIAATCTAEGPPAAYRLKLRFAESARAMLVDGGPFSSSVGLIYCGATPPKS